MMNGFNKNACPWPQCLANSTSFFLSCKLSCLSAAKNCHPAKAAVFFFFTNHSSCKGLKEVDQEARTPVDIAGALISSHARGENWQFKMIHFRLVETGRELANSLLSHTGCAGVCGARGPHCKFTRAYCHITCKELKPQRSCTQASKYNMRTSRSELHTVSSDFHTCRRGCRACVCSDATDLDVENAPWYERVPCTSMLA